MGHCRTLVEWAIAGLWLSGPLQDFGLCIGRFCRNWHCRQSNDGRTNDVETEKKITPRQDMTTTDSIPYAPSACDDGQLPASIISGAISKTRRTFCFCDSPATRSLISSSTPMSEQARQSATGPSVHAFGGDTHSASKSCTREEKKGRRRPLLR